MVVSTENRRLVWLAVVCCLDIQRMIIGNGLGWHVANSLRLWGGVVSEPHYHPGSGNPKTHRDLERQNVRPTREEIGHGLILGNCSTL